VSSQPQREVQSKLFKPLLENVQDCPTSTQLLHTLVDHFLVRRNVALRCSDSKDSDAEVPFPLQNYRQHTLIYDYLIMIYSSGTKLSPLEISLLLHERSTLNSPPFSRPRHLPELAGAPLTITAKLRKALKGRQGGIAGSEICRPPKRLLAA